MDLDVRLSSNCAEDEFYFRLYRWTPYCISLGANQSYDIVDYNETERDDIDVVKRPTGGRAILHAEELTYSVSVCLANRSTPHTIYKDINSALQAGLGIYNPALSSAALEQAQPDFANLYRNGGGIACFSTAARSELKLDNRKIVGSAQRKSGNKILQHGSILCGPYHKNITRYLALDKEQKQSVLNELDKSTTDISSVTGEVYYDRLKSALLKGMEQYYNTKFTTLDKTEAANDKLKESEVL